MSFGSSRTTYQPPSNHTTELRLRLASMSAISQMVAGKCKFLAHVQKASPALILANETGTVTAIKKELFSLKNMLTTDEANELIAMIMDSHLPSDKQDEVIGEIFKHTDSSEERLSPLLEPKQHQTNDFFENYLLQEEWDRLPTLSDEGCCALLSTAMNRCGFLFCDEPQKAMVVGLLGLCGKEVWGTPGLLLLSKLKINLRQIKKNVTVPLSRRLMVYPENPYELPEPWLSQAFATGLLVICPFHASSVHINKHLPVCRKNNQAVTAPTGSIMPSDSGMQLMLQSNRLAQPPPAASALPAWTFSACPEETAFRQWTLTQPNLLLDTAKAMWLAAQRSQQDGSAAPPGGVKIVFCQKSPPKRSRPWSAEEGLQMFLQDGTSTSPPSASGSATESPQQTVFDISRSGSNSGILMGSPGLSAAGYPPGLSAAGGVVPPAEPSTTLPPQTFPNLLDMISATRDLVSGEVHPSGDVEADGEDEEEGEEIKGRAKARARPKGKAKAKAKATAKGKAKAGAKVTAKVEVTAMVKGKGKDKAKPLQVPEYPGTKKHAPLFCGQCTVYMDQGNRQWRIKTRPASRVMINCSFKSGEPKDVWKKVQGELRRNN